METVTAAEEISLNGEQLDRAYSLLDHWTKSGNPPMPGACLLVGRGDRCLAPRFFGRQGPEKEAPPIRSDGLFLLASITKPVVYLAALQLVEQGKLCLSDRVVDHIPEFASNHKNEIRVADLMTHTSGLPDQLPDNLKLRKSHAPMDRFIRGAIEVAPLFAPRTSWSYQSMGTLVVAELVQRLTGMGIRDYIHQHILLPLEMRETALGSAGLDRNRIVRVEVDQASDWDWNSDYWQSFGAPWGGMFTSPTDFAKLCGCLLGTEAGTAKQMILSPATVRAMRTNQLDLPELDPQFRIGQRWGLGWKLNLPTADDPLCELGNVDVFGHTGATGTMVWMDPHSKVFMILLTTGIRAKAPQRLRVISNIVAASVLG